MAAPGAESAGVYDFVVMLQYESPRAIEVPEDASVGQLVASVQACNDDTESPVYYYLIGPSDVPFCLSG